MRYYSIIISNDDGTLIKPSWAPSDARASYTSFVNGKTIPSALNVELDVFVAPFATPAGGSIVRIWGVTLQEIGQSSDLLDKNIQVYGGMKKGLPLANPSESGLLFQGTIFQAFGNWIGTEMTLDLIVIAGNDGGTGTADDPKNIYMLWKKGTKLADAVKQTMSTSFPKFACTIDISDDLVTAHDEVGIYGSLTSFATYLKHKSSDLVGGIRPNGKAYPGVDVRLSEDEFFVFDGTTQQEPTSIDFQDLIGQPTWIDSPLIQFKTVMRADLTVGDWVKLPQTQITTTSAAQPRYKSAFQGVFLINQVRHVGNFRQPDPASWVTVFDAAPPPNGQ